MSRMASGPNDLGVTQAYGGMQQESKHIPYYGFLWSTKSQLVGCVGRRMSYMTTMSCSRR